MEKEIYELELTFNPNDVMKVLEAASNDGRCAAPARRSWAHKW